MSDNTYMNPIEEALDNDFFVYELTMTPDGFVLKYTDDAPHENVYIEKGMNLTANSERRMELYLTIQNMLRWLVDDGLMERRNPPQKLDADGREIPNE